MLKKIKSFWRYWADNKSKIHEVLKTQENTEEVFLPLLKKLNSISRRIGYKLETHKISGNTKITFTAHGWKVLFPKIIALAEKFALIPGFSVQAFIQPTEDLKIQTRNRQTPSIFRFLTKYKGNQLPNPAIQYRS